MNARNPIFIHYVYSMDRARQFYESVFEAKPTFASGGWTTLDFGAFELALHILAPGHTDEAPLPHAGLNLEVDSIETFQSRIEQRGGELTELREANARVPDRVATFRDPEGNGFELRQRVRRRRSRTSGWPMAATSTGSRRTSATSSAVSLPRRSSAPNSCSPKSTEIASAGCDGTTSGTRSPS
jgi:predicted enzyme related to lactoylglutathione lyase